MRTTARFDLPDELMPVLRRAIRLEWITIAYLVSVVVLMGLVMGSSQAMRTAWIEDLLSFVPPIAFLVAERVGRHPVSQRFPYGHHRAVTIAYVLSSFALLAFGALLTFEGAKSLLTRHHPTIGSYELGGRVVWQGWAMLLVLVWAVVPVVILGRRKLPLARRLHDKALFADADMNKADWQSGLAAGFGVVGTGWGLWWADALGALLISLSILHDGWGNLKAAVGDLMDMAPRTVDHEAYEDLPDQLEQRVAGLPWVARAEVRLREHGHVFFGEIFVTPAGRGDAASRTREVLATALPMDWRLHDLAVVFDDSADEDRRQDGRAEDRSGTVRPGEAREQG